MICNETDEIIYKLFKSLFNRNQLSLEESMKDSDFVFDKLFLFLFLIDFCF